MRRRRSRAAGLPRCGSSPSTSSTRSSRATFDDIGIVMQGGMYNTAIRALERLGLADVVRQHPRAALRPQCHLPADRCRADRASAQAKRAILVDRGGPARVHRAGHRDDPAPGRHPDPDRRQEHAADGRRVHRRRRARRRPARSSRPTGRTSSRAPPGPGTRSTRRGSRRPRAPSRRTCTPARHRSAPAARSGRSSRR